MNKIAMPAMTAYLETPAAEAALRGVAERMPWPALDMHKGGLATAARVAGRTGGARSIIAELGTMTGEGAEEALRALAEAEVSVVLLGERDDVATYRRMIQAGARDYLVLPVTAPELAAALNRPVGQPSDPAAKGRVIGVTSVRGGGGASFVAANLAWIAQARMHRQALLLDLDLGFGTQAVDFDSDPTPGLIEALLDPERVDDTYLAATLATPGDGLRLYSAEGPMGRDVDELLEGAPALIERLKAQSDAVLVDLPREAALAHPEIVAALDDLVILLSPGLAVARGYTRLAQRLAKSAPEVTLHPVLSQVRTDAGLTRKELSAALGEKIERLIPQQSRALARAAIAGRPLAAREPRNPAVREVTRLAGDLLGAPQRAKRGWYGLAR
ncbi:AAA family ATPase [Solirhodobacter olei]|uniref:AAA family ATPase n=1 Tax=Solirhodobacter olei TaxID=2493082 RepID=UPI000FD6D580|nr:hypothetical protein [Solirhodobacter olei]